MTITPKPAVFLRRRVGFTGVFLVRLFYAFLRLRPGPVKWQNVTDSDGPLVVKGAAGNVAACQRLFLGT